MHLQILKRSFTFLIFWPTFQVKFSGENREESCARGWGGRLDPGGCFLHQGVLATWRRDPQLKRVSYLGRSQQTGGIVAEQKLWDNVRCGHQNNVHLSHDVQQFSSGCSSLFVPGNCPLFPESVLLMCFQGWILQLRQQQDGVCWWVHCKPHTDQVCLRLFHRDPGSA